MKEVHKVWRCIAHDCNAENMSDEKATKHFEEMGDEHVSIVDFDHAKRDLSKVEVLTGKLTSMEEIKKIQKKRRSKGKKK